MIRLGATPIVDDAQPLSAILSARVRRWKRERSRKEINRLAGALARRARRALLSRAQSGPTHVERCKQWQGVVCAMDASFRVRFHAPIFLYRERSIRVALTRRSWRTPLLRNYVGTMARLRRVSHLGKWQFGKRAELPAERGAISLSENAPRFHASSARLVKPSRQFNGIAGRSLSRAALYARSVHGEYTR
jgi:hypothetical protein